MSEPSAGRYRIVADTVEGDPHEYQNGEIVTLTGQTFSDPEFGTRYQTTDFQWVAWADIEPVE